MAPSVWQELVLPPAISPVSEEASDGRPICGLGTCSDSSGEWLMAGVSGYLCLALFDSLISDQPE